MRVLLPKRYLKGIIAFLLFLIGTVALVSATLPASYQQQFGLSATGSIFADMFRTQPAPVFDNVLTATVTTDKLDYPPGSTVVISGSGFQGNEAVRLRVIDQQDGSLNDTDPAHQPWDINADSSGNISSSWIVDPDSLGHTLTLTADGLSSGFHAESNFTDSLANDFKQCANQDAGFLNGQCHWINSILQSGNANYSEGMSTLQRFIVQAVPDSGQNHTWKFSHEFTKGGVHAYDFLTSYEQAIQAGEDFGKPYVDLKSYSPLPLEKPAIDQTLTDARACGDEIPNSGGGTTIKDTCLDVRGKFRFDVEVPGDAFVSHTDALGVDGLTQHKIDGYEAKYGKRYIRIYSESEIVSASLTLSHTVANKGDTGDSDIDYVLTWKWKTTGNHNLMVEFAGHLSAGGGDTKGIDWGPGNGASSVSGGPYHIEKDDVDNVGLGSEDNQIKSAVIVPLPPQGQISVTKVASPQDPQNFSYATTTTSATSIPAFKLDDDGFPGGDVGCSVDASGTANCLPTQVFQNLAAGTYTITEGSVADWSLTDVTCVTDANSHYSLDQNKKLTIVLDTDDAKIACTFFNTKLNASLKVTKTPSVTDICNGTSTSVTYTYVVTNDGTADLTVDVTDDILGSIASNVSLAAGASKTFTKTTSISATTKNTVTATGKTAGGQTATASASATVTAHTCTISITKEPSTTDVCNGSTVSYTIKVTNNSDKFSWTGSVVDDVLGSLSASTTLAPGGSKTFTPSGSITGTVKNTATADGKFDDPATASAKASASATVTGHVCTISITKTPSVSDVCNGSTVSYTIKVTNNSDKFSWTGSVVDDILGSLSASTTLAPGGSSTFTPSGSVTGTVKNTATADGKFDDGSATSAKASASATVTGHVCTISITKTPSVTDVCNGSTVSYKIVVTNNSDKFSWTGSVVDDILGTLSASTTLAAGGSATFTPSGTISGTVKNTVTGDGKFDDGSTTSAKASASATVTGHTCTISITKEPSTTDVCNGSTVSYTIKVTNNSDKFNWTGKLDDDVLGSLSASFSLAPGGSQTFTPSGSITGPVKNTATADGKFDDGSGTTAKASASATVTGHVCSISITKTPSTTDVCNGASASYKIVVTNNSDKFSWTGSVVDDILGTLASTLTLGPGGTATYTPSGTISGTVKNTATANGKFDDGSGTTAKASASATVNGHICRITVKKKTVPAGDPAKFTFGGDLPGSIGDGGSLTVDVLSPGTYTTGETIPTGWDLTDISCSTGGSTTTVTPVAAGGSNSATYNVVLDSNISCTFTNTKRGTIIIKKITDPPNTGTFTFTTTSDASTYNGFNLNGGQSNTQSNLLAGTYTAKEGMQLGWILTGIGFNPPLADPKSCQVTGNGGSTGTGDVGTQTATINLKPGDTVTCVFENTGTGVTRTQGFWATHPELANVAWFGGSFGGLSKLPGVPDQVFSPCGRSITTLAQLMGGFWSGVSKTSTGGKRSPLDQARMQLLQQLLAAELNYSAFGTVPSGGVGMFAQWEAAYCGTNAKAISDAQGQAASYNSQGDSSQFTPGTSANSQGAKAIAAYSYWDVLP